MKLTRVPAILLSTLVLVPRTASSGAEFAYKGDEGPQNWAKLAPEYSSCGAGKSQSPVDLSHLVEGDLSPIKLAQPSFAKSIVNNGHTVQIDYGPGNTMQDGVHTFSLKQFHFHAPSEHTIDGRSFPMEIHFVHADADANLAVVGVLVEEGAANPLIDKLWKAIPAKVGEKAALPEGMAASALLPKSHDHYRYGGSLTTPPCTEGVRWYVLKNHVTASKEQLAAFGKTIGFNNNRPVQPVNARVLVK